MVPKIIHYCWFGGKPLPREALQCIESWKKFCPDYEIVLWNESNYKTNNVYANEALESEKWAFYSDYARLDVVYQHGGIYLDIDVELVKNLDQLLSHACFLGVESTGLINTGLGFGAEKHNKNVRAMLLEYENVHFLREDGTQDLLPCPARNTRPFLQYGFDGTAQEIQYLNGAAVYPPRYFCPLDYETGRLNRSKDSYSIHHFTSSWCSKNAKIIMAIHRFCKDCFGEKLGYTVARILDFPLRVLDKVETEGVEGAIKTALKKVHFIRS